MELPDDAVVSSTGAIGSSLGAQRAMKQTEMDKHLSIVPEIRRYVNTLLPK